MSKKRKGEVERDTKRPLLLFIMALTVVAVSFGIWARFFHITQNEFFFFDEGYYLNTNRPFLESVMAYPPKNLSQLWQVVQHYLLVSLRSGKPLFFLLSDGRLFWGGVKDWFVPRVISAIFGILTLPLIFIFARRFYKSSVVAWLSVAFLAILPAHVFYSRLALQEAVATFFFVAAMYFYLFSEAKFSRLAISAILFVCAYLSNYRLIMIPFILFFAEVYFGVSQRQWPDFRKWFYHTAIFAFFVLLIASIDNGLNAKVTFGWMFFQAYMARDVGFSPVNLLSYPYYLFRLEGFWVAVTFFANIYFLIKRQWQKAFWLCLYLLLAFYFSFAMGKGARYLSALLPFIAMAMASVVWEAIERNKKNRLSIAVICVFIGVLIIQMGSQSYVLARSTSAYDDSARYLRTLNPKAKWLSTQPYVQNLFVKQRTDVLPVPKLYSRMIELFLDGYRYVVIDPQVYISRTQGEKRFQPPLLRYLQIMQDRVKPLRVFNHFNQAVFERFVFEHNEYLPTSIHFLNNRPAQKRKLYIYDIRSFLQVMKGSH